MLIRAHRSTTVYELRGSALPITAAAGVRSAEVDLAAGRARVRYDPEQTNAQQLAEAVSSAGYPASVLQEG